jgi:hypothetical protein
MTDVLTTESEHEMRYRSGFVGFRELDGPPHWYCPCGAWRFEAKAVPHARTGNNELAARRSYARHVTDD